MRQYLPCLRGNIGKWVYYTSLMSLRDVAARVSFADQIHKSKKLSDMIQRQLKEKRGIAIAQYLHSEPERFFNSLVIAVYGGEPRWHGFSNVRPQKPDIDISDVPARTLGDIGFISLAGDEELFAVDGQHRLAGIKLAVAKDADLGSEQVAVIFISHAKDEKGLRRTRKLFTTLNKTARPVSKGEIIALDEADVMAIVVRHLVETHPFFTAGVLFSPLDNLPASDREHITTIGNLYEVLRTLFSRVVSKTPVEQLRYYRPPDEKIEEYKLFTDKYFRLVSKAFPPLDQYFVSNNRAEIIQKNRTNQGGHLLFRPVGLRILAEVVAGLTLENGLSLQRAIRRVEKLPMDLAKPPYADVIWFRASRKMNPGKRALARDLALYMLGAPTNENKLRIRYAGQIGVDPKDCKLPSRID